MNTQFDLADCQFSIRDAAEHLCISRSMLYQLIKDKKIKAVKLGGRTIVQGREMRRFMDSLARAA